MSIFAIGRLLRLPGLRRPATARLPGRPRRRHPWANGLERVRLCVLELRPDGAFRDLADLGSAARPPATAPMTWAPADSLPDRLAFVAPAPASAPAGGPFRLFGLFGALRAAAPPSGLFLANLGGSDLAAIQPRRS